MQIASITDIKNRLSEFLGYVRRGETVRVYDRATPVADIVPVESFQKRDIDSRLAEMELRGVIQRGRATLPASFFSEHGSRRAADNRLRELLLADRRKRR